MTDTKERELISKNISTSDRIIRGLIGTTMLVIPYATLNGHEVNAQWWQSLSMLLSAYPILTGLFSKDPFYQLLHINSRELLSKNRSGNLPFHWDTPNNSKF